MEREFDVLFCLLRQRLCQNKKKRKKEIAEKERIEIDTTKVYSTSFAYFHRVEE